MQQVPAHYSSVNLSNDLSYLYACVYVYVHLSYYSCPSRWSTSIPWSTKLWTSLPAEGRRPFRQHVPHIFCLIKSMISIMMIFKYGRILEFNPVKELNSSSKQELHTTVHKMSYSVPVGQLNYIKSLNTKVIG